MQGIAFFFECIHDLEIQNLLWSVQLDKKVKYLIDRHAWAGGMPSTSLLDAGCVGQREKALENIKKQW